MKITTMKKVNTAPIMNNVAPSIFLPKKHSNNPIITNNGIKIALYVVIKFQITYPENETHPYEL